MEDARILASLPITHAGVPTMGHVSSIAIAYEVGNRQYARFLTPANESRADDDSNESNGKPQEYPSRQAAIFAAMRMAGYAGIPRG